MSTIATTFVPSTILTPANVGVVNLSVGWGMENGLPLYEMGLGKSDAIKIGKALDSDKPVSRMVAIDTFKLVFAADRNAQLPRGTVNDTLARLTIVGEPYYIGTAMRGLRSYWRIGKDFKPRFASIVSLAREISTQLFISEEAKESLGREALELAARWPSFEGPSLHAQRLGAYKQLVNMAIGGALDERLSEELEDAWAAHAEDLMFGGFVSADAGDFQGLRITHKGVKTR